MKYKKIVSRERRRCVSKNFIYKHKLLNVILAAFLTVLALMVLVRLPENPESVTVTEQNSVYDLTGITNSDVT